MARVFDGFSDEAIEVFKAFDKERRRLRLAKIEDIGRILTSITNAKLTEPEIKERIKNKWNNFRKDYFKNNLKTVKDRKIVKKLPVIYCQKLELAGFNLHKFKKIVDFKALEEARGLFRDIECIILDECLRNETQARDYGDKLREYLEYSDQEIWVSQVLQNPQWAISNEGEFETIWNDAHSPVFTAILELIREKKIGYRRLLKVPVNFVREIKKSWVETALVCLPEATKKHMVEVLSEAAKLGRDGSVSLHAVPESSPASYVIIDDRYLIRETYQLIPHDKLGFIFVPEELIVFNLRNSEYARKLADNVLTGLKDVMSNPTYQMDLASLLSHTDPEYQPEAVSKQVHWLKRVLEVIWPRNWFDDSNN